MPAAPNRAAPWIVFVFLAGVYLPCLTPSYGPGDSAQHLLAAAVWGVPRPPGYPLQTALGALLHVLFGPRGVSALSALAQAGACALLAAALIRRRRSPAAAAAAALALGLGPLWRYYAQIPEVRGLNDLLAAAACLAALDWEDRRSGAELRLGLVVGLGLSHHPTFLLAAPAFLLHAAGRRPSGREAARAFAAAAAGVAAPYALLWARLALGPEPAYNPEAAAGAADMLGLWLRRGTGGLFSAVGGSFWRWSVPNALRHLGWWAGAALDALSPLGAAAAAAGLAAGLRSDARRTAAWAALFLVPGLAAAFLASQQMGTPDAEYQRAVFLRQLIMPFLGLAGLAALGLDALLPRLPRAARWAPAVLAAALALRPLCLRGHEPLRRYVDAALAATGEGDLLILDSDDSVSAFLHAQRAERRTADRALLLPWLFNSRRYIAELERRHPELSLPRTPTGPLSTDWTDWEKANPRRRVWAEASVRFEGPRAPRVLPRPAPGRRFLFTQEVFLARLDGA